MTAHVTSLEVLTPEEALGIGIGTDVLVVDETGDVDAYESALAPLGRAVVVARSGADALDVLVERDFVLVLVRVAPSSSAGLDTARLIRAQPRHRSTPILFIADASSTSDHVLEAYAIGAYDFVIEPVLPEVLRAKVRVYLQLQERTRQLLALARQARAAEAVDLRTHEFLAMLGHELRNPLAAMVGALDMLKVRDQNTCREISILDRQVAHLSHVVDDLVDVARVTQGKISLRRETVELARAISDALDAVRSVVAPHDVTVDAPHDLLVDADRDRLVQAITNLLSNAAKYTAPRGRIEIAATRADGFAVVTVRDDGRGIAATLLPQLFDLFVQGERAADRHEGGLGIGLTLVRRIVELHGGTIAAHSDGPGTGATFTVRWPVATSQTATAAVPPLPKPVAPARLRVLIVDDNADAAEMLAAVVGTLGHDVMLAHDGQVGLDMARDFAPDVALLDIGLPTLDGYELAARLRELPSCARTRLVAVTGYGQPEDRERSRRAGFAQHLVKPVDLATLRALLVPAADAGTRG